MRGSGVGSAGTVVAAAVVGAVAFGALEGAASAGRGAPNPAKVEAMKQRRDGSLKLGDRAPDAPVAKLDGGSDTILAHKEPNRPMVLVFGSFT